MLPFHKAALKIRGYQQKKSAKPCGRLKERENFELSGFGIGRFFLFVYNAELRLTKNF
jgi:hypothetical protein